MIQYKPDRMALLVSSTSWTADEDFSILLDAIKEYCTLAQSHEKKGGKCPKLLLVITGSFRYHSNVG
jgi:beta-1,4-mannosyltransferase